MRKILLILATLFSFAASAQTPLQDSLKNYADQYVRNSAITAFTNNRLNTLLKAIIENLGGSGSGGTQIELRNNGTNIQWKYTNQSDFFWVNLISIASLTGPAGAAGANGAPGPTLELQNNGTYIQYRPVGSSTWINLVALSAITGPPGSGGGGGGSSAWGSITGTLTSQLDLQAALAERQPIGQIFFTGLKTGMGSVTVPNTFPLIQTSGYSIAGKGGGKYTRTDSTGATRFRMQSADGQWWTLAEDYITPELFGAIGDSTDATQAIQIALDYTRSGTGYRFGTGTALHFTGGKLLYSKLNIHSGNLLTDSRVQGKGGFNYTNGNGAALIHIQGSIAADSFSITTDMNASGWGINGLQIFGGSQGTSTLTAGGLRVYSGTGGQANDFRITNNTFKGWGIEAIRIDGGSPYTVEKNMVQGCNNVSYLQAKGVPTGVIRAAGADATIINNEFTGSSNQGGSGNFLTPSTDQLIGAAYFAGLGVSKLAFNIYQVSECGLRHPGSENKYVSERFDTNAGSGLYFASGGSDNLFTSTQIIRNSLAGTGLYDGIYSATSGGRNYFDGITFGAGALYNSAFYAMRYFINDQKGDYSSKNPFTNNYFGVRFTTDPAIAPYNLPTDAALSAKVFIPQGGGAKRLTLNSATPSIYSNGNNLAFNSTATTITAFRDIVEGQQFNIFGSTLNGSGTYVKHGDSIKLRKGTDSSLLGIMPMSFVMRNKIAYQINGDETSSGGGLPAGGTTNQVLSKISSTDYATQWVTPNIGTVQSVGGLDANGFTWNTINSTTNPVLQLFQSNGSVTNAKLANMAQGFKGRLTGGTGAPEDMTAAEAASLLPHFSSSNRGLVPASGGGTANFLRADGTWTAPAGGGGGGITDPGANGILARTALNTVAARTITPATSEVVVSNGNGVSGNPVIALAASIARQQSVIDTAAAIRAYLDTATSVLPISYYPTATDSFPTIGGMVRKLRDSVVTLYTATPSNITGLVTQGTNVTITGSGTTGSPYVVNSSGGSAGVVATASEINTGTDNIKYATPLGLDGSEYITQGNEKLYGTTAGTGTAYTLTLTPAPAAYVTGMVIYAKFHLANTGAATINVNSLGAISIVKEVSTALVSGDIPINKFVQLIYNGTQFQLASPFSDVLKANLAGPTFTGTTTIPTGTVTTLTSTTGTIATLQGSTASSGALTIQSTSNGTKGRIILNSNLGQSITTIFGAQTLTFSFNTWVVSASGAYTVTLPAAGASTGVVYTIKKAGDANTITIQANGAETIDGANTQTLTTAYQFMTLQSNGTSWYLISKG